MVLRRVWAEVACFLYICPQEAHPFKSVLKAVGIDCTGVTSEPTGKHVSFMHHFRVTCSLFPFKEFDFLKIFYYSSFYTQSSMKDNTDDLIQMITNLIDLLYSLMSTVSIPSSLSIPFMNSNSKTGFLLFWPYAREFVSLQGIPHMPYPWPPSIAMHSFHRGLCFILWKLSQSRMINHKAFWVLVMGNIISFQNSFYFDWVGKFLRP